MSLISDLRALRRQIQRAARRRKNRQIVAGLLDRQGDLPESYFEAAVYYPDSRANMYQVRQWFEPMRELSREHPIVIVTRTLTATKLLLEETDIAVHYARTVGDLEDFVSSQNLGAVFYVNHAMRNFQMMRYGQAAHVSISHGESDKPSTSTNQFKAYDYVFVAGQAAEDRITQKLVDYDVSKHVIHTGRPQVNIEYDGPRFPADGRINVLYAPTWEGDRPSMNFTSVSSHGLTLVECLLNNSKYRVIYRPHPRIGNFNVKYREAHKDIVTMIEDAAKKEPAAGHLIDLDSRFGWHLSRCDVCISDISAVAYDWLATGKPLIMTWPPEPEAEINSSGLVTMLEPFRSNDSANVINRIERERTGDLRSKRAKIARYYFGEVGESHLNRFLSAARTVIKSRVDLAESAAARDGGATPSLLQPSDCSALRLTE